MKRFSYFLALFLILCAGASADQYADMVLSVAVSEIGTQATKGGYTKYGEWGGNAYGEYCSEFVSWCVDQADKRYGTSMLGSVYPQQSSCAGGAAWFKERGRYITVGNGLRGEEDEYWLSDGFSLKDREYIPQRGDLIYFEWYAYNRLDHVGIVEMVTMDDNGQYYVHTIEGNNHVLGASPTKVERFTYALNDPSIRGYGVQTEALAAWTLRKGDSGEAVIYLQKCLGLLGFYNGDNGGKLGKATVEAIKSFQKANGITQSGEADLITWQRIRTALKAIREEAERKNQENAAQAKMDAIRMAREALASTWFGDFDPLDEETAWKRLTAPIKVLDVENNEKVYLADGPNGKRKTTQEHRGFFYGSSVAVHVLEEKDGWVKIEAYNDCDELEQGWVRGYRIKEVTPNQTYGIIVDKMTQRLYLYKEGKLLTTLLVSTGTTAGANEDFNETSSGEFLLCSWTGGFYAGDLWCNYAIRFNGGDLLHLVPSIKTVDADGVEKEDFSRCESALGTRASHGCIRVQRIANEDGYNHLWLWNNLSKNVKLIVWDDDGRKIPETEKETAVYYNPNGGKKFHTTAYCSSVRSTYLPLSRITYGDLSYYPYNELVPCGTCNAPARPEVAAAWNSAIDEALEELEIEALINSQFTENGASEESAR